MMNRIIAITALLLVPVTPTQAQAPKAATEIERAELVRERLETYKERLALSAEQIEQMRPVLQDQMQALEAVRNKYAGQTGRRSRVAMARALRDVQDAGDARLQKILSTAQMDELKKIRSENRAELRRRSGR